MTFDPQYLEGTAYQVPFLVDGQSYTAATVHPAIILTQKLSDAYGRAPRKKDIEDVRALTNFWLRHERGSQKWTRIIQTAISALPVSQQETTTSRVLPYLEVARRRSAAEKFLPWLASLIPQGFYSLGS